MNALAKLQTFAANRGFGQYPLPRRRHGQPGVDHLGLRLVVGSLGLFGAIVFGIALIAMAIVAGVFIYAAFTA